MRNNKRYVAVEMRSLSLATALKIIAIISMALIIALYIFAQQGVLS